MKMVMYLVAILGMLMLERFRSHSFAEEDDDAGLFVGSARPLPARPPTVYGIRRQTVAPRRGLR